MHKAKNCCMQSTRWVYMTMDVEGLRTLP